MQRLGKIDPILEYVFSEHRSQVISELTVGRNIMTMEKSLPRHKTSVGVRELCRRETVGRLLKAMNVVDLAVVYSASSIVRGNHRNKTMNTLTGTSPKYERTHETTPVKMNILKISIINLTSLYSR